MKTWLLGKGMWSLKVFKNINTCVSKILLKEIIPCHFTFQKDIRRDSLSFKSINSLFFCVWLFSCYMVFAIVRNSRWIRHNHSYLTNWNSWDSLSKEIFAIDLRNHYLAYKNYHFKTVTWRMDRVWQGG